MTQWVYGTFGDGRGFKTIDGTFDRNNVLPAVRNTDTATESVTGDDSASLNVARIALPKNWKSVLVTGQTLIAEMDGDKVLTAGYLDKINLNLNGSVTLIVNGMKSYLARLLVAPFYGEVQQNSDAVVSFSGLGYTGLLEDLLRRTFSMDAPHEDAPRPANVLGNIYANTTATNRVTYDSKVASFETVEDIIAKVNTALSLNGVEVRFIPRVEKGEKLRIVWDVYIGDDNDESKAHINESLEVVLDLNQEVQGHNTLSTLSLTYSVEEIGNRVVSQSTFGNPMSGTGADITTVTKPGTNLPRFDLTYNPEAELKREEMETRLTKILNADTDETTATFSVLGDEAKKWKDYLGATIVIRKQTEEDTAEAFEVRVRCTSLSFSSSHNRIDVTVGPLRPRFPRKTNRTWEKPIPAPKNIMPRYSPDFVTAPEREAVISEIDSGYASPLATMQYWTKTSWWGSGINTEGQLGVATNSETAIHTSVQRGSIPDEKDIVKLFGTQSKTHGITDDGKVYGWGMLSEALGVDGRLKSYNEPRSAEFFGEEPIKKIIYPDEQTTLALSQAGQLLEISINPSAPLLSYEWKNSPSPIVDVAALPDTLYAVLEDGTVWAKGNSAYMAIGSSVGLRIEDWTQCQQTDGKALRGIKEVHALYAPAWNSDVKVVALLSNLGAIYRINTSPENDFRPQAWFRLTLTQGAKTLGLSAKGLYYLGGDRIMWRAFQQLEEDDSLKEFEDASEYKRWKAFSIVSKFEMDILGLLELNKELVIALDESGQVWTRGRNTYGELGTGTLEEETSFKKLELDKEVEEVLSLPNRTYVKAKK